MFWKRKSTVAKNEIDADKVKENAGTIAVIGVHLEKINNEEIKKEYEALKHIADYAPVSPKEAINKMDKKIANAIGDLKILVSTTTPAPEKVLKSLIEIRALYKEREAIYFIKD